MVGRKKKAKICDKVSQEEDRLSQLPESLICDNILCHLSTKDAVRTSVLSTRWRNLWRWVPGLDLDPYKFSNFDAFVSFVERFFDSHRESWIRKLRLSFGYRDVDGMGDLTSWIDAVTTRRIQYLDVNGYYADKREIPLSIYTSKTLVYLRLCQVSLCNAEFVALPCLKIMVLRYNRYSNETTLHKLISGSPVLEDLTIPRSSADDKANVLQVRSHTLKRVDINEGTQVVIDAPLLQYMRVMVSSPKNFLIVNLVFPAKLVIDFSFFGNATYNSSMIHSILTDIARVRELVISKHIWKEIFQCLKSGPVLQFHNLFCLNAKFSKTDLEMLPTFLESCPQLESFILDLVSDRSMRHKKSREPKVMFSTVPQCLVTSLKFVEWKRSISGYEGEAELVRYFLKNSTILEKLRLDVYYTEKAKCDFLKEVLTMPRCSSVCEIHCSFIAKDRYA